MPPPYSTGRLGQAPRSSDPLWISRYAVPMELTIDMTDKDVRVTRTAQPKMDQHGEQRVEKETGLPLWSVQVCVTDHTGGEVVSVTLPGDKPDVTVNELVDLIGLVAIPWSTNGRNGVAFKATSIIALDD